MLKLVSYPYVQSCSKKFFWWLPDFHSLKLKTNFLAVVENLTCMQCIQEQDGLTLFFNPIVSAFNMEIGQMIVELLDGASTAMQWSLDQK